MNILFLLPDQQRADFASLMGQHPVRTPNLDKLAARGTSFRRAWTPSPLCSPARACLALAKDYDRSPVRNNADNVPIDAPNFYRQLRDNGYRVGSCGKVDLLKGEMGWGLDGQHRRNGTSAFAEIGFTDGLDSGGKHDAIYAFQDKIDEPYLAYLKSLGLAEAHVEDFKKRELGDADVPLRDLRANEDHILPCYANLEPTPLTDEAYSDNWVGSNAMAILESMRGPDPWFLQVNFSGPHEPLDVTPAMMRDWEDVQFSLPVGRQNFDAARQQQIRRHYAAMIEGIDRWLGRMIVYLEQTNQLDDTLIVYSSDHGEMLGDWNLWQKTVPHEASVRVPLVIAGPGIVQGRVLDTPTSLLDLIPTFFDFGNAKPLDAMDGVSLKSTLTGATDHHRDLVTSGIGTWRAITDGRFKLIIGYDEAHSIKDIQNGTFGDIEKAPAQLFDLQNDPHEATNLGKHEPEIREKLKNQLRDAIAN